MVLMVEAILYLLAFGVLIPVAVMLTQVVCAVWKRDSALTAKSSRPNIAVLIPAHDESSGLCKTLLGIESQLLAGDRMLVVADNCTDDTAVVARKAGAEVVERFDVQLRGKGYALDFGIRHLSRRPPAVVVIVDADCEVLPDSLDRIARMSAANNAPVQALYLMKVHPGSGRFAKIAEFAWLVKNLVRPLGFLRLGLPCQLMGTGMAFPWDLIAHAPLATGHIVEDMQLGVDFARQGTAPQFCPDAVVESYFPANRAGTDSQRKRWEHGHLGMIIKEVPRLFLKGIRTGNRDVLALALDLCVPPIALLVMLLLGTVSVSGLAVFAGASYGPLSLSVIVLVMLILAVGLAWVRFGRAVVPFSILLLAGVYAFRKIPLYAAFLVRRQVTWIRSKRDGEHPD